MKSDRFDARDDAASGDDDDGLDGEDLRIIRQLRINDDDGDDDDDDDYRDEEDGDESALDYRGAENVRPRGEPGSGLPSPLGDFTGSLSPAPAARPATRRKGSPGASPHATSDLWLSAPRMTSTEVTLRLGVYLAKHQLVRSNVSVALTGAEITKRNRPRFPVEAFLRAHGVIKTGPLDLDWRALYKNPDSQFGLLLHDEPDVAQLSATLPAGGRLLVEASGGPVGPTRSSAEHKLVRSAIGRAVTLSDVEPEDVIAAAVPRSSRTRKVVVRFRTAPRLVMTKLIVILIDRAGMVDGLQRIGYKRVRGV